MTKDTNSTIKAPSKIEWKLRYKEHNPNELCKCGHRKINHEKKCFVFNCDCKEFISQEENAPEVKTQ
jgi:hypothetical protein